MGEKLVRIRQPGRNDDAARPVDPEKERAPRWWSEFCSPGFPSPTQDACGPHGGNEHTRRAIASDGVHSPRQCGPAGLVGNFRSNAPLHRSARDSRRRCGPRIYIQGSEGPGNFQPVFRIPIEDEIPGSRPKWKRLPQLLDDPTARRMLRDVNVQDASTIVADDEEAVERAERDRWHGE